jgi:hypothetical protein
MIKLLTTGLPATLLTLLLLSPALVPVHIALSTGNHAYYFLAVPGLLGFSYLNGLAMAYEEAKRE